MRYLSILTCLLALASIGSAATVIHVPTDQPTIQAGLSEPESFNQSMVMENFAQGPLAFTQNNGQWDERALFRADAGLASVWITTEGTYYKFIRRIPKKEGKSTFSDREFIDKFSHDRDSLEQLVIKATFVGANSNPSAAGDGAVEYKCNYFLGNDPAKWRTDVPNYRMAVLKEIYPGIDLRYYGTGDGKLEYDFVISPGAEISKIQVRYEGAKSVTVNDAGELVVETEWNTVTEKRPVVYQIAPTGKCEITGTYAILEGNTFGFKLNDKYCPELVTVIDPVLSYSTFFGGSVDDMVWDIAADEYGNAYITGATFSGDFPLIDPFDPTYNGGFGDAFVTKLSKSGNEIIYSTFIGGSGYEAAVGVAVDSFGSAYITGGLYSTNFPTINAIDPSFNGVYDCFITKLVPAGNGLAYSTYLGGTNADAGYAIAVNDSGNAFITGGTNSSDFPTANAFDDSYNSPGCGGYGCPDIFVAKLSANGTSLAFSTYVGGSGHDGGLGLEIDQHGNCFVIGSTDSPNLPVVNAFDNTYNGGIDAFVLKLNSDGKGLSYCTYLGGGSDDINSSNKYGIDVDTMGYAYVTGSTASPDFPIVNAFDGVFKGGPRDIFISKLAPDGQELAFSTFVGGSGDDDGNDIALDVMDNVCIAGSTSSTDFPLMHAFSQTLNGQSDAFVLKLLNSGNELEFSTYFGGGNNDQGYCIYDADSNCLYLAGRTMSADFPIKEAFDNTYNGGNDIFIAKFLDRMNSVPTMPVHKSPADNAIVATTTPALWLFNSSDPESDPLNYDFEVYDNSENLVASTTGIVQQADSTGWTVDVPLGEDQTYHWRARAFDGYEYSAWTMATSFYVNASEEFPSAFLVYFPPDTDNGQVYDKPVEFIWGTAVDPDPSDSVRYKLLIAIDPAFTFMATHDSIYQTRYPVGDLDYSTHYWWKVEAIDTRGNMTPSTNTADFWTWILGDANGDRKVTAGDAVFLVSYIFRGGPPPIRPKAGDANGDCRITVGDAVYLISYIFREGPAPKVGCAK